MFGTFFALKALIPGNKSINPRINLGYENLLNNNYLYNIRKAIESICEFEYKRANQQSDENYFLNLSKLDLAFYIAQRNTSYLLTSFAFNRAIANYYSGNTSLVFPLNKEWQQIFKEYEIKSNRYLCLILWRTYILGSILRNLLVFAKQCKTKKSKQVVKTTEPVNCDSFSNIYFYDISSRNLPSENGLEFEKNIITWYKKNVLLYNSINVLHNVKDQYTANTAHADFKFSYYQTLFFNDNFYISIRALIWYVAAILKKMNNLKMIVNLLLIITEMTNAKKTYDLLEDLNLTAVVFNNSIGSIKPLWAVVLEKQKVRLDYCFYACYSEPLDIESNYPIDGYWKLARWNNYYVVDKYQSEQLSLQVIHKPLNIYKDVIPWWSDANIEIRDYTDNSIALFDTVLHNNLYTLGTLNQFGWYKVEIAKKYLLTALETAADLDLIVFYKIKRIRESKYRNSEHWNYINDLLIQFKKNVIQIDDRVAPERIIKNTAISISKPLSTTAIIAKQMEKPSVYLDPTMGVLKTDPALRGIELVYGKNDLKKFVQNVFNYKNLKFK